MKAKIKFIVIGFIILLIPSGLIIKRAIAIDIQKKAIELYQFGDKHKDLDKALEKINLAIKLAPRSYLFYATKAQIFESQQKYHDAISEFQKIFEFKENYAEGYVAVGMDYERLKLPDSAKLYYNFALESYDKRIINYSSDRDRLCSERVNRAFVLALLEDTVKSRFEFNQLKVEYPEYREVIKHLESCDKGKDFINIRK